LGDRATVAQVYLYSNGGLPKGVNIPYDELLSARIRNLLDPMPNLVEKKMFGGVGFLVNGNMACGVHKNVLIVRVGAASYEGTLSRSHTRPFDMTGRPMAGWVMVEPNGCTTEIDPKKWVEQGLAFTQSLPGK
jgi:hypothetical protein